MSRAIAFWPIPRIGPERRRRRDCSFMTPPPCNHRSGRSPDPQIWGGGAADGPDCWLVNPGASSQPAAPLSQPGGTPGWLSGWSPRTIQTGACRDPAWHAPACHWRPADGPIAFGRPWREEPIPARRPAACSGSLSSGSYCGRCTPGCMVPRGTGGVRYPAGDGRVPTSPRLLRVTPAPTGPARRALQSSSMKRTGLAQAWTRPPAGRP